MIENHLINCKAGNLKQNKNVTVYWFPEKGEGNIPNIALFVWGCIKLCIEPTFTSTKCHHTERSYRYPGLQTTGMAILQLCSIQLDFATLPILCRYISAEKKHLWPQVHQTVDSRKKLQVLGEKETLDSLGWFLKKSIKVTWLHASSPELTYKHQPL